MPLRWFLPSHRRRTFSSGVKVTTGYHQLALLVVSSKIRYCIPNFILYKLWYILLLLLKLLVSTVYSCMFCYFVELLERRIFVHSMQRSNNLLECTHKRCSDTSNLQVPISKFLGIQPGYDYTGMSCQSMLTIWHAWPMKNTQGLTHVNVLTGLTPRKVLTHYKSPACRYTPVQ